MSRQVVRKIHLSHEQLLKAQRTLPLDPNPAIRNFT
jgi:hypothetical protein